MGGWNFHRDHYMNKLVEEKKKGKPMSERKEREKQN